MTITRQSASKLHTGVKKAIKNGNLTSAFRLLGDYALQANNYRLSDRIMGLRQSYGYLLQYMIEGSEDPHRESMLGDIREELLSMADSILRDSIAIDSSDIYSETLRITRIHKQPLADLTACYRQVYSELLLAESVGNEETSIKKEEENLAKEIFNTLWVMPGSKGDRQLLVETVASDSIGPRIPALMVSALSLSLLGDFDRYKFEMLLDIIEKEISEELTARAMVGLVMALARHKARISAISSLMMRMEIMRDSLLYYRRFREIVFSIIRSRDTDRVSAKMKEEVIPEIMKLKPEILSKMREAGGDMESMAIEDNPEWQELMEKSGLADKMKELSEMQEDGSDLMMVAFSNLKQFPFFNEVANWFLPFDITHTAIELSDNEKKMVDNMLTISRTICQTDRYSLALALGRMPADRRSILPAQLSEQLEQHKEEIKEAALKSASPAFDEEVTRTVRDLYRFFKLFRKKDSFRDPFSEVLQFTDLPVVGDLMADTDLMTLVAEFYLKRNYYPEALSLLTALLEDDPNNISLLEKAGYCYQCMKFYDKALEAYTQAELSGTPSKWLIRKLAVVYRQVGNYRKAYEYYLKALESDPENRSLLLNAGYSALHADMPAEALKHYYHAEYIKSGDLRVMRAIAWAEMLRKEFEKSQKYYDRIISSEPLPSDFLNLGHLKMLTGNYKEAAALYAKAANGNEEDFAAIFKTDLPTLEKLGADSSTALLILDWMRFNK